MAVSQSQGSGSPSSDFSLYPHLREVESQCLTTDFVCVSHLRWDFVYQRPQHLLSRFAKNRRVFYFEEPIFEDIKAPRLDLSPREDQLVIAVPKLPHGLPHEQIIAVQKNLLDQMIKENSISDYTLWFYTPMALEFSRHLRPARVLFDAMDELSHFKGAPQALLELETELLGRADHVFTGGHSLYEAKKHRHPSVHAFPSSIDHRHFASARNKTPDPADQACIPHPRVGFFGVVDERFDIELLAGSAKLRPEWQFVIIGPICKIDEADLPKASNIHYLGMKSYQDLPKYLAHWDLAMLPFALNDSTKFISPTKTPEYLAAGKPVVSTAIRDVIRPYAEQGLVRIVNTPESFVREGQEAIDERASDPTWMKRVDDFLSQSSWDKVWKAMAGLERAIDTRSMAASEYPASSIH